MKASESSSLEPNKEHNVPTNKGNQEELPTYPPPSFNNEKYLSPLTPPPSEKDINYPPQQLYETEEFYEEAANLCLRDLLKLLNVDYEILESDYMEYGKFLNEEIDSE